MKVKNEKTFFVKNRKAYFNYEILEKYEAGIVLKGTEVKSIRAGNVSINESYAGIRDNEVFIYNMDISPYNYSGPFNHEPKRVRKLLLKKSEIKRLIGSTSEKGLTLIPIRLYFKNGLVILEIGLARGKKLYDKRESIKKKMVEREISRAMRRR